jgi:hypothetical protein
MKLSLIFEADLRSKMLSDIHKSDIDEFSGHQLGSRYNPNYDTEKPNAENPEWGTYVKTALISPDPSEFSRKTYKDYSSAIGGLFRNTGRNATMSEEQFIDFIHVVNSYGSTKLGWIFGFDRGDVFIGSHFAPKSARSGRQLILNLSSDNKPVILAITSDLVKPLTKLGWIKTININEPFSGSIVEKTIMVNKEAYQRKEEIQQYFR